MSSLESDRQRMIYLITYSRANTTKFPSRESFASTVLEAWQSFGIRVLQWVTCIEGHSNTDCDSGDEINKYHFHMALKLAKKARWLQVRKYLDEKFEIQVNFSDYNHNTYFSAYRYVTKEDREALHSPGHPYLSYVAPLTESAINSRKRKAKGSGKGQKRKKGREERLSIYDVCQIVQAKGITSRLQLVCLAMEQSREGKHSLKRSS